MILIKSLVRFVFQPVNRLWNNPTLKVKSAKHENEEDGEAETGPCYMCTIHNIGLYLVFILFIYYSLLLNLGM